MVARVCRIGPWVEPYRTKKGIDFKKLAKDYDMIYEENMLYGPNQSRLKRKNGWVSIVWNKNDSEPQGEIVIDADDWLSIPKKAFEFMIHLEQDSRFYHYTDKSLLADYYEGL